MLSYNSDRDAGDIPGLDPDGFTLRQAAEPAITSRSEGRSEPQG
jgi:hypothetical protein